MPVVTMPDGVAVDMPDQIDPALGARLRAFHDTTPHEATSGPMGFANGVAEIAGKGLGNMPMGAVHAVRDLVSRATGHGPHPSEPTFPLSPNAQTVGQSIGGELTAAAEPYRVPAIEPALEKASPIINDVAAIAPVAGAVGGMVGGVRAASAASAAEAAANAPAAVTNLGMRTAVDHPIARNVAGSSGREALATHNQSMADPAAGAVAGIPQGTKITPATLSTAREAPETVYARAGDMLPTGPLSPTAQQMVKKAGTSDLVTHTPDAQTILDTQKARLLSKPLTGPQTIDNLRALRKEGYARVGSEDVEQQNLGHAQLDLASALEQHIADTLPPNANVSMDQLASARQALAQNHTVQGALKGGNVDMQALARIQRANPNLMTGPLKDMAEFGDLHPEVSSLPGKGARYNPPGFLKDVKDIDLFHPIGSAARVVGGVAARRVLTGSPEAAAAVRAATPVRGLGGEFNALPPGPLQLQPPPGQAFEAHQPDLANGNPQVDMFGSGANHFTAGPPSAPPPPKPGGDLPLADLLSHGVEQSSAAGLSVGPMGAPAPQGIPFNVNAEHAAGGLSLADELGGPFKGQPQSMADFAGVKSQGVPEGIVQRAPSSRTKGTMQTIDFPSGAEHPSFVNNASGESPASLEAQSRLKGEKARGTRPVMVGPEGDEQPLLHDVTAVDRNPSKGGIILDAKTGKVINSGNMKPAAAQALVNRWKARRPLGDEF